MQTTHQRPGESGIGEGPTGGGEWEVKISESKWKQIDRVETSEKRKVRSSDSEQTASSSATY